MWAILLLLWQNFKIATIQWAFVRYVCAFVRLPLFDWSFRWCFIFSMIHSKKQARKCINRDLSFLFQLNLVHLTEMETLKWLPFIKMISLSLRLPFLKYLKWEKEARKQCSDHVTRDELFCVADEIAVGAQLITITCNRYAIESERLLNDFLPLRLQLQ